MMRLGRGCHEELLFLWLSLDVLALDVPFLDVLALGSAAADLCGKEEDSIAQQLQTRGNASPVEGS